MGKDETVPILKPCPFRGDLWQTDRFAPDHDLHLRASAPRPLGEDGYGLPLIASALGRLRPEFLRDALDGDQIVRETSSSAMYPAPELLRGARLQTALG